MIDIIAGSKGKGKTKILIQRVNEDIKVAHGTIVYLDKNNKQMYKLSNQIRLIVVTEFDIIDTDIFIGFILGILSQDHDLEKIYLDSFLTIAFLKNNEELDETVKKLEKISARFDVDFVISASLDKDELPERLKEYVSCAL